MSKFIDKLIDKVKSEYNVSEIISVKLTSRIACIHFIEEIIDEDEEDGESYVAYDELILAYRIKENQFYLMSVRENSNDNVRRWAYSTELFRGLSVINIRECDRSEYAITAINNDMKIYTTYVTVLDSTVVIEECKIPTKESENKLTWF